MDLAPRAVVRPEAGVSRRAQVRRLGLLVERPLPLDERQLAAVMREVAGIWQPYGIEIGWGEAARAAPDARLRVVITEATPGGEPTRLARATLGWIEFVGPGRPRDVVTVSLGAVRRLLDAARLFGRPLTLMAPALQDRFITQALGRSLAHEIGHYLCGTADHAPRGLMRERFSPAELLEPGLDAYRLDPQQRCELPGSVR